MKKHIQRVLSVFLAGAITIAFVPGDRLAPNLKGALAFTDVAGHPSEPAISRWAQLGVVEGYGGRAYPDRPATRVEFVAAMNRVLRVSVNNYTQAFTDVSSDTWYYNDVQKAFEAGLAIGVGNNLFAPERPLNREMMVTMMGRIFGLYNQNTSILSDIYADETDATYGRGHLAAFAEMGVTMAVEGHFEPHRTVTRAEMFQFINDFLPHVFTGADVYSGRATTGNMIIRSQGVNLNSVTLNGSIILADGIGTGNVSIRNSVINGRLIIRGGGPHSVDLTGTTVTEGVYVYNPNCNTRIFSSNNHTKIGEITAMTGVIIEGAGFSTLRIPLNAVDRGPYILRDVTLDSLNVERSNANIRLESVVIDNVRFANSANGSTLDIASEARVNYLEINANNIKVTGDGSIDYLVIRGDKAEISMQPRFVTIGPGLTAMVNGTEIKGSEADARGTLSNVTRDTPEMDIRRDIANTGGGSLALSTAAQAMCNLVTITSEASVIQLSDQTRPGYWIGFLIPAPPKAQDPVVKIGYDFEGGEDYVYSIPFVSQNNIRGILVYIPVKAEADLTGSIDTAIYITWGNGLYETLNFKGHNFRLGTPTSSQMTRMVNQFGNAIYPSYNKIATFTGSEALKRLLLADNPIGLDTRSFDTFSEEDKNSFASQMYTDRASLTSKPAIQRYLDERITTTMGALYLVNGAMTAAAMQKIIEDIEFAGQLGINTRDSSDYRGLSDYGKLHVANTLVIERNKLATGKFPNEEAVAKVFNDAVLARRRAEITLLTTINSTNDATAMQRLIENKPNADMIGVVTASDPYKSLVAAQKLEVATKIVTGRQYESLNEVRKLFEELVGTPDNPIVMPPEENPNVLGVEVNPNTLNLVVGSSENIIPTIRTSTGSFSTLSSVIFTVNNANLASVDDKGTVRANARGRATVTITSRLNSRARATVTVNVVDPVAITALRIVPPNVNMIKGSQVQLSLQRTPANGNDRIFWSVDNDRIATVSSIGVVTALESGYTNVTAITATGVKASSVVFVSDTEPNITIDDRNAPFEIGLGGVVRLTAAVSPINQSNTEIVWASSNPGVASVDRNGVVRATENMENLVDATITSVMISASAVGFPNVKPAVVEVRVNPDRFSLELDRNILTMYRNGTFQLKATVRPDDEKQTNTGRVRWSSDNPNIVSVDANGNLRARAAGIATITATYDDDSLAFDTCVVTVLPSELRVTVRIDGVVYNASRPPALAAGRSSDITVDFNPLPDNMTVRFSSSDDTVATVSSNGRVTGVSNVPEKVTIWVTPMANETAIPITFNITGGVALTGISVAVPPPPNDFIRLNSGSFADLRVVFNPSNATNKGFDFGMNISGHINVERTNDPSLLRIQGINSTWNPTKDPVWGNVTIDNPDFIPSEPVSATNTSIITVSTITSIGGHDPVIITITAHDGSHRTTVRVEVEDVTIPDGQIRIMPPRWVYRIGESEPQFAVLQNEDGNNSTIHNVTWTRDAENIDIDPTTGQMTTRNAGPVAITATRQGSSVSSTKRITVAHIGVDFMNLSSGGNNISGDGTVWMATAGDTSTRTINAAINDSATYRELSWNSSNRNVVQVNSGGVLTALAPGTATITVTALNTGIHRRVPINDPRVNHTASRLSTVTAVGGEILSNGQTAAAGETLYIGPNHADNPIFYLATDTLDLIVNDPMTRTFTVEVTPPILEGISITHINDQPIVENQPITVVEEQEVTVRARVSPNNATVSSIDWLITVDDRVTLDTFTQNPTSVVNSMGITEVTFTVPANAASLTIACTAIMDLPNPHQDRVIAKTEISVNVAAPSVLNLIAPATLMGLDFDVMTAAIEEIAPISTSRIAVRELEEDEIPIAPEYLRTRSNARVLVGRSINLYPHMRPVNANLLVWETSDPSIAVVNGDGVVTGVSAGRVTITLTSADGNLSSRCTINVLEQNPRPSNNFRLSRSRINLNNGNSYRLGTVFSPRNSSMQGISWYSTNPEIATVDVRGNVTAVSGGIATIVAEADDGRVARCMVTVRVRVNAIRADTRNVTLRVGDSRQLNVTVSPANASTNVVTWRSSSNNVATVSADGTITAHSKGNSTITASVDGRSTSINVTVNN